MASIILKPLILNDAVVTIDGSDFESAVSSVAFTPSTSAVTFTGMTPDAVFNFNTPSTWVCDITHAQDFETEGSLSLYLFNNEGETVNMTFKPRSGSGPSIAASVVIVPGAIGGATGAVVTATVSLGVQGRPTLVPAP